jgi:hypothetical protein
MAVANLPPELRYEFLGHIFYACLTQLNIRWDPENVILIGTIPGPAETKTDQLSNFLAPLVDELLTLWGTPQTVWALGKSPTSAISVYTYHTSHD